MPKPKKSSKKNTDSQSGKKPPGDDSSSNYLSKKEAYEAIKSEGIKRGHQILLEKIVGRRLELHQSGIPGEDQAKEHLLNIYSAKLEKEEKISVEEAKEIFQALEITPFEK